MLHQFFRINVGILWIKIYDTYIWKWNNIELPYICKHPLRKGYEDWLLKIKWKLLYFYSCKHHIIKIFFNKLSFTAFTDHTSLPRHTVPWEITVKFSSTQSTHFCLKPWVFFHSLFQSILYLWYLLIPIYIMADSFNFFVFQIGTNTYFLE